MMVDKLNEEVRQCVGSLQDIKVTLAAIDAKYDHILSLLPKGDNENKEGLNNSCVDKIP